VSAREVLPVKEIATARKERAERQRTVPPVNDSFDAMSTDR